MELIYEQENSRKSYDERSMSSKLTPHASRKTILLRELYEQRKKLFQKASQIFHLPRIENDKHSSYLDEHIKYLQIAPLLPDEIIKQSSDDEVRTFGAVIIFADVSGFTDLSDKYQSVDNGASKLSTVLNFYLGNMIQEILSQKGDIIKFAGDAFLASFKITSQTSFHNAVQNAIDVSLLIQKNCKNFMTEVGVILNVKIAISCGEVHFSVIGDENLSHYVIVGEPIWQVKGLQDHILPGEILLTQSAWFFTQETFYTYQFMREHRCYKITGFRDQTNVIRQQYEAMNMQGKTFGMEISEGRSNLSESELTFNPFSYDDLMVNSDETFVVRSTINMEPSFFDNRKSLRRFVISPLLNAIDLGDSIDSLTEMRSVVIVFANFVVPEKSPTGICHITNLIFIKLNSIVTAYQGTLNKVSLFDKDMMFLSIFGLRGQMHENDCEIGLRCANEIHKTFKEWSQQISIVSIGVTSGNVYCGLVGHTLRREYSVISVTVNKAARLMMAYPGIVSCDEDTLIRSKMNFLRHFKKLPNRKLKGLKEIVRAFEFSDVIDFEEEVNVMDESENCAIFMGREKVMEKLHQCVISAIESFNSNEESGEKNNAWCFMIKGDGQQGKTRVINELYRECTKQQSLKCLRLILNPKHTSMPYWTVKYCLTKILESEHAGGNIKNIIVDKLSSLLVDSNYFYALNSIFNIHFKANKFHSPDSIVEIQKILIRILCHNLSSNFWIVFIDDADYIDLESFNLLPSILETKTLLFILTIGKYCRKWTQAQKDIYLNPLVTQWRLQPIDKTFHKDIACHNINVSAIPIEFERFLHENSNGNPGWIETCANTLLHSGKLKRKPLMMREAIQNGMILMNGLLNEEKKIEKEFDMFQDILLSNVKQENFNNDISDDERVIYVAVLLVELTAKDLVGKYTTRKLMLYDSLSYHDQLICKCAALLGNEFDRDMLNYLSPSSNERKIAKTIMQLFQQNILKCASNMRNLSEKRKFSDLAICYCERPKIAHSCRDLPKYASCSHLKFQNESFRHYIYETLTEKQRIDYHKRCISYFYYQTKKCTNCSNNERFQEIDEFELNASDGIVKKLDNENQKNMELLRFQKLFSSSSFKYGNNNQPLPIVLNFINHDFHQCDCISLLYSAFSSILQHCHGKEMKMKLLYAKVILADICIKHGNTPRALVLLDECSKQFENETSIYDNKSDFITYLRGRVFMLRGVCSNNILQFDDAIIYYRAACDLFQISFPRKFDLKAKCKLHYIQYEIKKLMRRHRAETHSRINILIIEQTSYLMQLFYDYYMSIRDFNMAKLAAFWSIREALRSSRRVGIIAKGFTCVIEVSIISDNFKYKIDIKAITEIFRSICNDSLNAESLNYVVKLYGKIIEYNFLRNKIMSSIKMGEIAKKICYNLPSHEFFIEIVPIHFMSLTKMQRISELKNLLMEFNNIVKYHNDNMGIVWYYALAMDLILDTCHGIVTYDECYKIYIDLDDEKQSLATMRFMANFWLWSIRNEKIEESERLMEIVCTKFSLNIQSSIIESMIGIRVVEALSLHYKKALENKNFHIQTLLNHRIKFYLNKLKYDVISSRRCFQERLLLHELHIKLIKRIFSREAVNSEMSWLEEKALKKEDYFTFNYIRFLKFNLCKSGRNHWLEFNMKNNLKNPHRSFYYLLPI